MYKAVIFDFLGTLFFETSSLAPGAEDLLRFCQEKGLMLAAVTAGQYDTSELSRLKLDQYIPLIRMVQTYESKTPELFSEVISQLGVEPKEVIGVGDLLHREIKSLNQLGATTISVHTERAAMDGYEEPHYRARDLYAVKKIIHSLMSEN